MNQTAIDFNNKGVAFLKNGLHKEALGMFLGSMELAINKIQGEDENQHNSKFIRNATAAQQQDLPINNLLDRLSTVDDDLHTTTTTEDKSTTKNEYMYTKALSLPSILDIMVHPIDDDYNKKQAVVYSAVIIYNTALTYHIWNTEKYSSIKRAIKLYEMALALIMSGGIEASIIDDDLTFQLSMALVTNMMNVYHNNHQGLVVDLSCTSYLKSLSDVVCARWYYSVISVCETTVDYRKAKRSTTIKDEIEDMMSNTILLLNNPQNCAAGSA